MQCRIQRGFMGVQTPPRFRCNDFIFMGTFCKSWEIIELFSKCIKIEPLPLCKTDPPPSPTTPIPKSWICPWDFKHYSLWKINNWFSTSGDIWSSADNLCKQFGPRSGWTKRQAWSGSKLFDILMVLVKDFLKKINLKNNPRMMKKHAKLPNTGNKKKTKKKKHAKLPSMQI